MHEYKCTVVRVVDGDTVDVDIDLGFGVWLRKERVRMFGNTKRFYRQVWSYTW